MVSREPLIQVKTSLAIIVAQTLVFADSMAISPNALNRSLMILIQILTLSRYLMLILFCLSGNDFCKEED